MRFVDVKLKCGWPSCEEVGAEGDEVVTTVTITIGNGKPREIDLCKGHREHLLDEVLGPILKDGRILGTGSSTSGSKRKITRTSPSPSPGEGAGAAEGPVPDELVCQVEDCDRHGRPLRNTTGMAQHVIRTHGYESLAQYRAEVENSTG